MQVAEITVGTDKDRSFRRKDDIDKILEQFGPKTNRGLERLAKAASNMQALEWKLARLAALSADKHKLND